MRCFLVAVGRYGQQRTQLGRQKFHRLISIDSQHWRVHRRNSEAPNLSIRVLDQENDRFRKLAPQCLELFFAVLSSCRTRCHGRASHVGVRGLLNQISTADSPVVSHRSLTVSQTPCRRWDTKTASLWYVSVHDAGYVRDDGRYPSSTDIEMSWVFSCHCSQVQHAPQVRIALVYSYPPSISTPCPIFGGDIYCNRGFGHYKNVR